MDTPEPAAPRAGRPRRRAVAAAPVPSDAAVDRQPTRSKFDELTRKFYGAGVTADGAGQHLAPNGAGARGDRAAVAGGKPPAGWLGPVQAHLDTHDGLTDGTLPRLLAQAVLAKAATMPPLELVQALEKCENMALKLKAAKFLRDTGKVSIDELRKYATDLMKGDDDGHSAD